jgi:hypothetical protein
LNQTLYESRWRGALEQWRAEEAAEEEEAAADSGSSHGCRFVARTPSSCDEASSTQ